MDPKTKTMLQKILFTTTLFFLIAAAGYGQRFYAGANIGSGFQNKSIGNISGQDFKIDANNFAWKAYGGIGWRFLGLEGGYRDFGQIKDAQGDTTLTSRTRGGDLFLKGSLHIAFLEFYGKAGGFFKKTENKLFSDNEDFSDLINKLERGTDFAWGLGLQINLGTLGLRLEWEQFQSNPSKLGMLSFGANIGFGNYR